jgi:guanylate kinase
MNKNNTTSMNTVSRATKRSGMIFVLSAPSGAGKTTVADAIVKRDAHMRRVVTTTTRQPRRGERQGKDYCFVSCARFKRMAAVNAFAEHAVVHGHCYGTPRAQVETLRKRGYDVLLVIDVQGGLRIREQYPEARLIFLKPLTMKVLGERLRQRASDTEDIICQRLKNANKEMRYARQYDVTVVNDILHQAVEDILRYVQKQREIKV